MTVKIFSDRYHCFSGNWVKHISVSGNSQHPPQRSETVATAVWCVTQLQWFTWDLGHCNPPLTQDLTCAQYSGHFVRWNRNHKNQTNVQYKTWRSQPVQFWTYTRFPVSFCFFAFFWHSTKVIRNRLHTLKKKMQMENIKGINRVDLRICNIWMINYLENLSLMIQSTCQTDKSSVNLDHT